MEDQALVALIVTLAVTLFVGILGFVGVMITIRYNGRLAREQREDERNHERETLRTALIEELKINQTALRKNAKTLKDDPTEEGGGVFVPNDPMEDVYLSAVSKIGLLSELEVSRVINAYLSLRTHNAKLFLYGVQDERVPRHIQIPQKNVAMLIAMLESVRGPIDEAIDALSQSGDG